MTRTAHSRPARTGPGEDRAAKGLVRRPGPIALAAALVLAATTGLPLESATRLVPQADDRDGPFLGI